MMPVTAKRLSNTPIIHPFMDVRMGGNINGPSLIRVPDWVKKPLGQYYLYFADHKGRYIRMAYADNVLGAWTMYVPGVLDVVHSLFEPVDPPEPPPEDRPDFAASMEGGYLYAHIASPDVHVDNDTGQIRMYYHGLLWNGDQQTRVAYSTDGLIFTPRAPLLGPPYFRVFSKGSWVYAVSWGGVLLRARGWDGPFEEGPVLPDIRSTDQPNRTIRHAEAHIRDGVLHIFFTCIDDKPERIFHSEITLSEDWNDWVASDPQCILQSKLDWEGAELPLTRSKVGGSTEREHALRDPCVFEDMGKTYLLYCGAAECGGIGVAELTFKV